MESESPQNLYAKNLKQPFGYPLRSPEPKSGLPPSYAENGLHIGDVGYVDDNGVFEVLFNICLPPDHDLHRDKDLRYFEVGLAKFSPNAASFMDGFSPGRALCHGIQGPQGVVLKPTQGSPCEFKACSTSGAILVLPSGAVRQVLDKRLEEEFRELAEKNALEWSKFAGLKSLYLITGFYKASTWHLASFHDVKPDQVLLERNDAGHFTWNSRCDFRQSREGNSSENQAVLISGFKIEVRDWDKHVLVERLSTRPRSIWSEMALLASTVFSFLLLLHRAVLGSTFKLRDRGANNPGIHLQSVPALSPPFHPSDVINRYLLDKNPNIQVAITHDDKWLAMIEKNELSFEDMMDEGRFRVLLEANYGHGLSSNNVVYLRTNAEKTHNEARIGSHKPVLSHKVFSVSTDFDDTRQFIITAMRAENALSCLARMPVGFYVVCRFNGTNRRTQCKPVSLHGDTIEWDDEIMLPVDSTIKLRFEVIASHEFEPIFGNGEMLWMSETSMSELADGGNTHILLFPTGGSQISDCPSLLVTLEERRFDSVAGLDRGNGNLRIEDNLSFEARVTDEGHNALLQYQRGIAGREKLLESATYFRKALSLCPPNHEYRAAALSNCATLNLFNYQVHDTTPPDLNLVIDSYRMALELRLGCHPDRSRTLLRLAQALLYRQMRLQCEASVRDEIETLVVEIKQICSETSYDYRAAVLVHQTLKLHELLASEDLSALSELVSELDWSARLPPLWHFDRPYRLINFGVALRKYFGVTGHLGDLDRLASTMKVVLQLLPDGNFAKPWVLAFLGDVLCIRSVQGGNISDLKDSILMLEEASKLTPDGHPHKPWMLSLLGDALRARFLRHGAIVDLDSSICMIEGAVKMATGVYSDKPWMLTLLGDALRVRFLQRGVATDLDRSISMIKQAVRMPPGGATNYYSDRPWMLVSFGNALRVCFLQHGGTSVLRRSIDMIAEAVKLTPDGHFRKPWMLFSLGDTLRIYFQQHGPPHTPYSCLYPLLDVMPSSPHIPPCSLPDPIPHTPYASHTSYVLRAPYTTSCPLPELIPPTLYTPLCHLLDAIPPAPPLPLLNPISPTSNILPYFLPDPTPPAFYNPPGSYYPAPTPLPSSPDLSGYHLPDPTLSTPNNPPGSYYPAPAPLPSSPHLSAYHLPDTLPNNSNPLDLTFNEAQKPEPVTSVGKLPPTFLLSGFGTPVHYHLEADRNTGEPSSRRHLPSLPPFDILVEDHCNNLALFTNPHFQQHGYCADVENSISMIKLSLECIPDTHAKKPRILTGLGVALLARFLSHRQSETIVVTTGGFVYPQASPTLQSKFLLRLPDGSTHDLDDLAQAILTHQSALELLPDASPHKACCLTNLGSFYFVRFWFLRDLGDLDRATSAYKDSIELLPDSHPEKTQCLNSLAFLLQTHFYYSGDLAQIEEAISRHRNAVKFASGGLRKVTASFAVDTFSMLLRTELECSHIKAIELLEQGREVLWSNYAHLRCPLDEVIASGLAGKTLAEKFTQLTSFIHDGLDSIDEDRHDRICRLHAELEQVVADIRDLPGLSHFLLPPLFSDLQQAASEGPVIIVNSSKHGCDVLIVFIDRDPVHIPLHITGDYVLYLTSRLRWASLMEEVLRELWDIVVSHVVDALRVFYPYGSRIWWCPTAEFRFLPLHAAGPYREGQHNLSDCYISSYTPTLGALIRARQRLQEKPRSPSPQPHFMFVGLLEAFWPWPLGRLYPTGQGIQVTNIEEPDSCISDVTEELNKNEWVHFASSCCCCLDREHPYKQAFALYDGYLTIQRILRCEFKNAEFAFLSTCHNACGDEENPDEAIHLAAAIQFAGFRSIVGTLWRVELDQSKITLTFYNNMINESGRLDYTRAAYALHKTMNELKGVVPLEQRINYIHLGV